MKHHIQLGLILLAGLFAACKKEQSPAGKSVGIFSVNKSQDTLGATLIIYGQNFDTDTANDIITFNKASTKPFKVTPDGFEMDVKIPKDATTGIVKVSAKNQTVTLRDTFFVVRNKYTWAKMSAFPGGPRDYSVCFTVNGNTYVGTGMNFSSIFGFTGYNDLWEYNPATDTWTKKGDVPPLGSDFRANGFSFVIGNNAYVGGGISATKSIGGKDVMKYDPVADKWTTQTNLQGMNEFDVCFAGTYQNNGYIFSLAEGNYGTYEYDPVANTVQAQGGARTYQWCVSIPDDLVGGGGTALDNINFHSATGPTILHPNYSIEGEFVPKGDNVFRNGIYYNNGIYMSFGDEGYVARFDMKYKIWSSVSKQKLNVGQGAVWFMIGTKIYAVGGNNGFFSPATDNVWMMDLSQYIR